MILLLELQLRISSDGRVLLGRHCLKKKRKNLVQVMEISC